MKKFLVLILFLTLSINSSPWVSVEDISLRLKLDSLSLCEINIPNISKFPYNLSNVYNEIEELDLSKKTEKCQRLISELHDHIKESVNNSSFKIGFESEGYEQKLQSFGDRQISSKNLFIETEATSNNWSFKIRATKLENNHTKNLRFDESYISYTFNNKIITLGRTSKWWSPSWEDSLILSNNARPSVGLSFRNNLASSLDFPLLSFLGPLNYEIFINQLEEDRFIPKAKLVGAYVSFSPHSRFNFSLFRTGQIGGQGRPENLKTLGNFIIGRDNTGTDGISGNNEPGNQLAGGDFSLRLTKDKNLEVFGQIVGEDQSNLVPTRTIYNLGLGYSFKSFKKPNKIIVEHTDTDVHTTYSGVKGVNIAYNHHIYRDGYRYYKKPIGASIDADSQKSSLSYYQEINSKSFVKVRLLKADINENLNSKNYWGSLPRQIKGYEVSLKTSLSKNLKIFLEYSNIDDEQDVILKNKNLLAKIELFL